MQAAQTAAGCVRMGLGSGTNAGSHRSILLSIHLSSPPLTIHPPCALKCLPPASSPPFKSLCLLSLASTTYILPWPWQCRVASASPLTSLGDWHESALWHFCDTDPSECSQFFVFTKYSCWGYVPLCVRLEEGEPCPSSSTSSKIASPKLLFL